MDKKLFQAMLERRGYRDISFEETEEYLECTVNAGPFEPTFMLDPDEFSEMTIEDAVEEIDLTLGQGMYHVSHGCGLVLLYKAEEARTDVPDQIKHPADEQPLLYRVGSSGWDPANPFSAFPRGHYTVPLSYEATAVDRCPGCGEALDLSVELPLVDDPDTPADLFGSSIVWVDIVSFGS